MAKTLKNFGLMMSLGFLILMTSGCVALLVGAAAGAGGVAYVKGSLEKNFDKPVYFLPVVNVSVALQK